MTDTETRLAPLTREDVRAIVHADAVVFRTYKGASTVEAFTRGSFTHSPRIYTATEQRLYPETVHADERRRTVAVDGTVMSYTRDASRRYGDDASSGFAMVHSAQHSDSWGTIASLLRAGDELTLSWVGDALANEITREAGVHADELRLIVQRGDSHRLTFVVDSSVCLDNTARMVKP